MLKNMEPTRWHKEESVSSRFQDWTLRSGGRNGEILASMVADCLQGDRNPKVRYDFRINDSSLAEKAGMNPGECSNTNLGQIYG